MKKKIVALISFIVLMVIMFVTIICLRKETVVKDDSKIQIVATLFPQYDFAKQIGGDKVEVKLLLNSGVETHNYEPTPKDMISINNSDLFLFTGENLEPWTSSIINSINSNCKVCNISKGISLIKLERFEEKYMNNDYYDEESENHHHDKDLEDSHIWLDPRNAVKMIDNITEELCTLDEENVDYYRNNAEKYKIEILELDSKIEELINNSQRNKIAFGGEFAYSYFIERYQLGFASVYNNCGHGEDPSIGKVKYVIDYINKNNLPVVFYEELSEGTVAKMISEETKAESLVLYSIHNGNTKEDTYLSLMNKNFENLKKALN